MFRGLISVNLTKTKWKLLNKTKVTGQNGQQDAYFGNLIFDFRFHLPDSLSLILLLITEPLTLRWHSTHPNTKLLRQLERKMKKIRNNKYTELLQGESRSPLRFIISCSSSSPSLQ